MLKAERGVNPSYGRKMFLLCFLILVFLLLVSIGIVMALSGAELMLVGVFFAVLFVLFVFTIPLYIVVMGDDLKNGDY